MNPAFQEKLLELRSYVEICQRRRLRRCEVFVGTTASSYQFDAGFQILTSR